MTSNRLKSSLGVSSKGKFRRTKSISAKATRFLVLGCISSIVFIQSAACRPEGTSGSDAERHPSASSADENAIQQQATANPSRLPEGTPSPRVSPEQEYSDSSQFGNTNPNSLHSDSIYVDRLTNRITITAFKETPAQDTFKTIGSVLFDDRVIIDPEIKGSFQGLLKSQPVTRIFDEICQAAGCTWTIEHRPHFTVVFNAE